MTTSARRGGCRHPCGRSRPFRAVATTRATTVVQSSNRLQPHLMRGPGSFTPLPDVGQRWACRSSVWGCGPAAQKQSLLAEEDRTDTDGRVRHRRLGGAGRLETRAGRSGRRRARMSCWMTGALSSGWCSSSMASTRKPYSVSRSSHNCGARIHIWVGRGGSSRSKSICSRGATSLDGPLPCRSVCRSERISGAPGRRPSHSAGSARCGVGESQGADGVCGIERRGLGEVLDHISVPEFHPRNLRVCGGGVFVLGR